uniref:Uncharacterized protein n=1 Tax=uncultured bacterium contig00146 TaxID=1181586 RepID=A0A806K1J0_9BACT|nr:hypothetical protein [uncultured bacterium contig00146]
MDLSSLMGGNMPSIPSAGDGAPKKDAPPPFEYKAQAASPTVSGEASLTIGKDSLMVASPMSVAEITFAGINAVEFANYAVTVKSDDGDYVFSRMGEWAERFCDALREAWGRAVLRAFFVKGSPLLTATGDYSFSEDGALVSGAKAAIHVYDNCVAAMPSEGGARRVPLCFVTAVEKGQFQYTLKLGTGESYTFSRLGYDTDPFANTVERQIKALREKALATVKEIDATLTATQASQIANLLPEGAAAEIGQLAAIAPSFLDALERKIEQTRMGEGYAAFKEMCDPAMIWTGVDWMIAPSPDGRYAAVEFAEADTATFVYKTGGDFPMFAAKLNRALEAISFKREVIRLTDEELLAPEYADYFMASRRTASLQFVRANFAQRVIHSSADAWRRSLSEAWGA